MGSTRTEVQEPTRMKEALESGSAWAKSLKVGDMFMGAGVEARRRYPYSPVCQRLFISGALDVLEVMRVIQDMDGRLIEYRQAY